MEYNKRRFQKANDKKVLHKVKKHWVVMSMALLMAIGGEAVATHVSAHADTANSNGDQNNGSMNMIKERLNQSLVQGQKQAQSNNNQSAQQVNQAQLNNKQASQKANNDQISQQASVLHQQIMKNAMANGALRSNSSQGRTTQNNQNVGTESNQNTNANGNVSAQAPKTNVKAPKVNVASDAKADQINVKNNVSDQNQVYKHNLGSVGNFNPWQDSDSTPIYDHGKAKGTWNNAHWEIHNDGNMYIHDGTLTTTDGLHGNFWAKTGLSQDYSNHVINLYTKNLTVPSDAGWMFNTNAIGADITTVNAFKNLQKLDVSGINVSNVTNMGLMFDGWYNAKSIVGFNNWDTSHVTNYQYMFCSDETMNSLDLPIDTAYAVSQNSGATNRMFQNDAQLDSITLGPKTILSTGSFQLNPGQSFSMQFSDGIDPHNVSNVHLLDDGHSSYPGTWNLGFTGNWNQAHWALDNAGDLIIHDGNMGDNNRNNKGIPWQVVKHVYFKNAVAPNDMSSLFANLPGLQSVDFNGLSANNSNFSNIFTNDNGLESVTLTNSDKLPNNCGLSYVTSSNDPYTIRTIDDGQSHPGTWIEVSTGKWGSATWTLDNQGDFHVFNGSLYPYQSGTDDWPSQINQKAIKHIYTHNVTVSGLINGLFDNISDSDGNFSNWYNDVAWNHLANVQTIDVSGLNTSGVTDFKKLFTGDTNLTSIDGFSDIDASHVTDVTGLFMDDSKLTHVDTSKLTCAEGATVNAMFLNTKFLRDIDLSHMSHSNWENNMFSDDDFDSITLSPQFTLNNNDGLDYPYYVPNSGNAKSLTNYVNLRDGNTHPGTWKPFDGQISKWGSADCILDSDGDLVLANGTITGNRNDAHNINWNGVQNIVTSNVSTSNSAQNLFQNLQGLQSFDGRGMTTPNNTNTSGMFANDGNIQWMSVGPNLKLNNAGIPGVWENNRKQAINVNNSPAYGTYYNIHNCNFANINYVDWRTGQLVKSQDKVPVIKDSSVPVSDIQSPANYRLANAGDNNNPSTNSNNYLPNLGIGTVPQTYTIPVVPNDVMHYGYWGTAHYELLNDGTLWLFNGDMEHAREPDFFNTQKANDKGGYYGSWHIPFTYAEDVTNIKTSNVVAPVDAQGLFAGGNLFDNMSANNGSGALGEFNFLQHIDLSGMNTANTTNMNAMFHGDDKLLDVKFGNNFVTNKVSDMAFMFDACPLIKDLNLSSFDTSNVKSFEQMFYGCFNASDIDLANAVVNPNANVNSMFNLHGWMPSSKIKEITLGPKTYFKNNKSSTSFLLDSWNNIHGPWLNSANGRSISDLSDLQSDRNPGSWIQQASAVNYTLNYVDEFTGKQVGNNTIKGVKNAHYLPINPSVLPSGYKIVPNDGSTIPLTAGQTNVTVPVFNPSNMIDYGVWGTANYFLQKNGELDLRDGDMQISQAPAKLRQEAGQVKSVHTFGVTAPSNATGTFSGNQNGFTNVNNFDFSHGFDTSSTINMDSMFSDLPSLQEIDLSQFNTNNTNYMQNMFANDPNLQNLGLSSFAMNTGAGPTNTSGMFNNDNKIVSLILGNNTAFNNDSGLNNGVNWIDEHDQPVNLINNQNHLAGTYYNSAYKNNLNMIDINYMFGDQSVGGSRDVFLSNTGSVNKLDIPSINGYNLDPNDPQNFTVEHGFVDVPVDETGNWGQAQWLLNANGDMTLQNGNLDTNGWSGPNPNDVKTINTINVKAPVSAYNIFDGLQNLTKLNVSGLDTSESTNLTNAFAFDPKLQSVTGLNNIKSGDNATMQGLLCADPELTSVDLTGMDTSKVNSFMYMFNESYKLRNIYGLNSLTTNNATNMAYMFGNTSLTSLDLRGLNTSNVTTMSDMFLNDHDLENLDMSGIDTSKVNSITGMFSSDNGLAKLTLGPNTKLNKFGQNLGNSRLLTHNMDANGNDTTTAVKNGTAGAGTYYAYTPVELHFVDNAANLNSDTGKHINVPLAADYPGDKDVPSLIAKAGIGKNGYTILPTDQQDYTIQNPNGNPYVNVKLRGNRNTQSNLKINVDYETGRNDMISNNVPVTITGLNGETTYFDPAELSNPNGYVLDTSAGKTANDYAVNVTPNGDSWQGAQPTVYFKGTNTNNDQVMINQVVESPAGEVLSDYQQKYTVSGKNVGDTYTVDPSAVTKPNNGYSLNAGNKSVTGHVFSNDNGTTYLSQPTDTIYYTDPNAKGDLTVKYVDQAGNQVAQKDYGTQAAGVTLNDNSIKANVPQGYSLNGQPSFKYGRNNRTVSVGITGDSRAIDVEYDFNGKKLPSRVKNSADATVNGKVGKTVSLVTGQLPTGYVLDPADTTYYKIGNSNSVQHLNLISTEKTIPVNFVNQRNNQQIGTTDYSAEGRVASDITLPNAPAGYTYVTAGQQHQTFSPSDVDAAGDQFKPVTIDVKGDSVTVPVKFIDQNGRRIGQSDNLPGQIGNSVSVPAAPQGYKIDSNQLSQIDLTGDQIDHAKSGKSEWMNPVNVYVRSAQQTYPFVVQEQEWTNHKKDSKGNQRQNTLFNTITKMSDLQGSDGDSIQLDPKNYAPAGYAVKSDNPVTVKITDQGLVDGNGKPLANVVWKYTAKNISKAITFSYVDSDGKTLNTNGQIAPGQTYTVGGIVNSNKTLTHSYQVPQGYVLDSGVQTNYTITPKQQTGIVLHVHAMNKAVPNYDLKIVTEDPSGKVMNTSDRSIPITAKLNGSEQISTDKYYPSGYNAKDYTFVGQGNVDNKGNVSESKNNSSTITVNNTSSGLSSTQGAFIYRMTTSKNGSAIQPITVHYVDQNGSDVTTSQGSDKILNGSDYAGETIDVSNALGLPKGYTEYPNQAHNYTFNDSVQNADIYVEGKQVETTAPVQLLHTSAFYPNQNQYLPSDVQEIVQLPINGRVGDHLKINSSEFQAYLPEGYSFAKQGNTAKVSDKEYPSFNFDYSNADYSNHEYDATLTPSDANPTSNQAGTWHSDSWDHRDSTNPYWADPSKGIFKANNHQGMPLLVLQAQDNKTISFDFFDSNNRFLKTITISNNENGNQKHSGVLPIKYDPSYNDPVDISSNSPYKALIPAGYYYNGVLNNQVRFGLQPKHVAIHVVGKQENVAVDYVTGNDNHSVGNGGSTSGRLGDLVSLPETSVPAGYHLASDQPTQYQINYADDPASKNPGTDDPTKTGNITRSIKVEPDVEILPIKFVNQDGKQVGNINYQIKGKIGDQITLPNSAPQGYTLKASDTNKSYTFSTGNMNTKDAGTMNQITMNVTGKSAVIGVNYVDAAGHRINQRPYLIHGQVGDTEPLPTSDTTAYKDNLPSDYDINNQFDHIQIQPSDAGHTNANPSPVNLSVIGKPYSAKNLKVQVNYEDSDGQTTATDTVPVVITGQYDTQTYFDPANVAKPAGYQLDKSEGKTRTDYAVNMDQSGSDAQWANGQPTIYLKGDNVTNKNLLINQVVESPNGTIMKVMTSNVPVSGNVGDSYSVDPESVPVQGNYSLASKTHNDPNAQDNQTLTGRILEGNLSVYLSQPADTLYYVDSGNDAKSTVTVNYVNQAGQRVGQASGTDFAGGSLDLSKNSKFIAQNPIPAGYQYDSSKNQNQQSVKYGRNNRSVNVYVVGDSETVSPVYYDNDIELNDAPQINGHVGDEVELSDSNMQPGYHLASDEDLEYTINDNNNVPRIQIAPNEMTLPIKFTTANGQSIGSAVMHGKRDDASDVISNSLVPQGYYLTNANPTYDFQNGQVSDAANNVMSPLTLSVKPDAATVPVNYVDQNNSVVHSSDLSGTMGQTVTVPALKGYTLANDQYQFDSANVRSQDADGDAMKPINVYVNGAVKSTKLPVQVVYEENSGRQQSTANKDIQVSLANGSSDTFYPSNLNVPDGYTLDSRTASSMPFVNNNGTIQWKLNNHQVPTVYFKANLIHQPVMNVTQIEELSDGRIVNVMNSTKSLSDQSVGNHYSVKDGQAALIPTGFDLKNDSDVTGTVLPNGQLSNDHMTVTYVAQGDKHIELNFQIHGLNYDVSQEQVDGDYDKSLDAMDYLPVGYQLDSKYSQVKNLTYRFNNTDQSHTIYVVPSQVTKQTVPVTVKLVTPSDKPLSSDKVNVPLTSNNTQSNGSFTIGPNDAALSNYSVGYTPKSGQSDVNGQTNNGVKVTSNPALVFVAKHEDLPVKLVDQNGKSVSSSTVNGYYGEHVNVVDPSQHGIQIPQGYSYVQGAKDYTLTNQMSSAIVMIQGDAVQSKATVTVIENDPNGHRQSSYQLTEPVNGRVGDTYELDAASLAPNGYIVSLPDQKLTGTIGADHQISNSSATFNYKLNAATTNLKPIDVIYLANGEQVGKATITAKQGDYAGETVNAAAQNYNLPSNYQLISNENVPVQFSTADQAPAYVDVQPTDKQSSSYNADVIQKFYAPNGQLVRVNAISVPETGRVGSSFTIDPSHYAENGYDINNAQPVTGQITAHGLTNGMVTYNYDADMSNADNSHVAPIEVTYQSNGKPVGSAQRVDGYMGETVDVAGKTEMPAGYALAAGQNSLATFGTGTKPQQITLNVQPVPHQNVGKITVFYNDVLNHKLVNQITINSLSGSSFDVEPYQQNVPKNYQFVNVAGQPTSRFNDGTQDVMINVQKIVSDQVVYEDISDDKDPNAAQNAVVAKQSVQGVEGTRLGAERLLGSIPSGYEFVKLGAHHPVLTGGRDVVYVKRNRSNVFSHIHIDYVKHDPSGKQVGSDQQIVSGRNGDSFDLASYESQLPEGYQFVNASTPISYFTNRDQSLVINVQRTVPKPHYGTIKVHFVNDGKEVGSPITVTGHDGNVFDVGSFEHEAPEGYNYAGIQGSVPNTYVGGKTQDLYIKVN